MSTEIDNLEPDEFLEMMRTIKDTGEVPADIVGDTEDSKESDVTIETLPNDTDNTSSDEGQGVTETLGDEHDDVPSTNSSESDDTDVTLDDEGETDPEGATENELDTTEDTVVEEDEPTVEGDTELSEDDGEETLDEESEEETDNTTEETDTLLEELSKVEFKVRGKTYKSLTDPEHLITAQKKALGYDMVAQKFAKVKPFVKVLEDSGLLADEEAFNLVIEASKGNKDAIAQLAKNNGINPFDLDVEAIDKEKATANNLPNPIQLQFEEFAEAGQNAGVDVSDITNAWDDNSVLEVLNNPTLQAALIEDKNVGLYDEVHNKIDELARVDPTGMFSKQSALQKYSIASKAVYEELQAIATAKASQQPNTTIPKKEVVKNTAKQPRKKIVKPINNGVTRQQAEEVKKASVRTTSTTVVTTPTPEAVSLDNMSNEEFLEFMRSQTD